MSFQMGIFSGNGMAFRNQMPVSSQVRSGRQGFNENALQMKQMLRSSTGQTNAQQNVWGQKSVVEDSLSYSDRIRTGRENAKKTSLALKKLQYNYKSISSKILRSKTSQSARQVVSQARREVIRLQRKRGDSECDQEELDAAITHAKAMVRLAKKKVRHLEEEELAKVTGGPCAGGTEEKEELREEDEEQKDEEELADLTEADHADEDAWTEADLEKIAAADISDEEIESMTMEAMEEFLGEMQQTLKDMLEEFGLDDLFEDLKASAGEEMDPADYKMMKIKHRCKEMKDLVKADADYLKVIFKKMEESKGKAVDSLKGMGAAAGGSSFTGTPVSMPAANIHIDIPVSDMGMSAASESQVDVSV